MLRFMKETAGGCNVFSLMRWHRHKNIKAGEEFPQLGVKQKTWLHPESPWGNNLSDFGNRDTIISHLIQLSELGRELSFSGDAWGKMGLPGWPEKLLRCRSFGFLWTLQTWLGTHSQASKCISKATAFVVTSVNLIYLLNSQGAHSHHTQTAGTPSHCLRFLLLQCLLWHRVGKEVKEEVRSEAHVGAFMLRLLAFMLWIPLYRSQTHQQFPQHPHWGSWAHKKAEWSVAITALCESFQLSHCCLPNC